MWGFDPADREHWRVAYFPQLELTDVDTPDHLPDRAHTVAQPLSFAAQITFPSSDLVAGKLGCRPPQQRAYDDLIAPGPGPIHQLLGHPDPVQAGDMAAESRLAANGIPTGGDLSRSQLQRRDELVAQAETWQLLLHVDSDSGAGLDWSGGGRLYVWIRETDRAARNFDHSWMILQTD